MSLLRRSTTTDDVRELRREVGKMGYFYEAEVKTWLISNFSFSYSVCSEDLFGGVLLQSPYLRDFEERQMFFLLVINQASKRGAKLKLLVSG